MTTVRVPRSEAGLVGRDVGDGVGCHCAGVDLDGVHRRAVDVGHDVEVEVGLRADHGGAEFAFWPTELGF